MSNNNHESITFIGPDEQIQTLHRLLGSFGPLIDAPVELDIRDHRFFGAIESLESDGYLMSMSLLSRGTMLCQCFPFLSSRCPKLLMLSSSSSPYGGYYMFEAWYGGKRRFSSWFPIWDNNCEPIPGITEEKDSLLQEIWACYDQAACAYDKSLCRRKGSPRRALNMLKALDQRCIQVISEYEKSQRERLVMVESPNV